MWTKDVRQEPNKLSYIEFVKQDFVLVKHLCDIGVKCKMLSATNDRNRIIRYKEKVDTKKMAKIRTTDNGWYK